MKYAYIIRDERPTTQGVFSSKYPLFALQEVFKILYESSFSNYFPISSLSFASCTQTFSSPQHRLPHPISNLSSLSFDFTILKTLHWPSLSLYPSQTLLLSIPPSPGGTELTISGFGFTPDVAVTLDSSNCVILNTSESEITCKTPMAVSLTPSHAVLNFQYAFKE